MASCLWGTETSAGQMTWQSFDRRQKWKFYWLMETIAHYNGFPLKVTSKCKCIMLKKFIRSKTKSTVTILSPLWHWMSFENWKLSESKLLPSFFHWSLKKNKKHCKRQLVKITRCRYVCYHIICWRICFLLGKMSQISASRFSSS